MKKISSKDHLQNEKEMLEKINKILSEKGVISLAELGRLLGYKSKNPWSNRENTFRNVLDTYRNMFEIFSFSVYGCSHGSQKFLASDLFDGLAFLHKERKYISLRNDKRIIDFVVKHIPKPVTTGKVRALTHKLTRMFGKKRARTITKRVYNYSAWDE